MFDPVAEFPILRDQVFFNHAAVAPLPARTAGALRAWSHQAQTEVGDIWPQWSANLREARLAAARLIGCTSDEIAFSHNTTHGLICIANSLDWRPGDNVILPTREFPANVHPWKNLAARGVACRFVADRRGRFRTEDFIEAMDSRTRLVSLSLVRYADGYRMPAEAIAEACRNRSILVCLDAIQAVGAIPVDVDALGCDFLVADGHKWLLAPEGMGILYIRRGVLDRLNDSMTGWAGRVRPSDYDDLDQPLRPMAMRFEEGSHAMSLAAALGASLSLFHEVGAPEIWKRIDALNGLLVDRLQAAGFQILSQRADGERSGIVAFTRPGLDPRAWVKALADRRCHLAARGGGLRASPHFYNQQNQIDTLIEALAAVGHAG